MVIAGWASRYLDGPQPREDETIPSAEGILVRETGIGGFQQQVTSGAHQMLADEPVADGGGTLRMYAARKGLQLGTISVNVSHGKVHAQDCAECEGREGRIDRFERRIMIEGGVPPDLDAKIVEIANKCPVHRTLEASSVVVTQLAAS